MKRKTRNMWPSIEMFQQDLVTVLIGTFGFKDELELALKWEWILLVLHYGKPKYWKGQWSVKINWNQGRECCQELFFHLKQSHFSSFSDDHPCFSSRVFNSIQLLETIHVLDSKSERAGKSLTDPSWFVFPPLINRSGWGVDLCKSAETSQLPYSP